jgi:transposase
MIEELQDQLAEKDQQIRKLETEKTMMEYDLKDMRSKWFSHKKKQKEEDPSELRPKKRGAPQGHPGWFRKKPGKIDVVEEVRLEECPQCGDKNLSECEEIEEHVQEDIVVPEVQVTQYRRHTYWCRGCKKVVYGYGREEMPNSYIGPNAKALSTFLREIVKVSHRNIQSIFERFGLKICNASVPGFHNQARRKGMPLYEQLKEEIKKAPVVHADETGSPMDGKNYWNWIFATTKICLHVVRETRGQKVVEEILGKTFNGTLLADFYSAYNSLDARAKQRCLVHLLRELKKALECSAPGDSVHVWCTKLKNLIQQAIELAEQYEDKKIKPARFEQEREQIKQTLQDFQFPDSTQKTLRRLSKRLVKFKNELFTFLDQPGIPYHNNHAEQLLRNTVLLRKITFGHRSVLGALNHEVLMSLQQTAQLNGKDPITLFKRILISQNKKLPLSLCLNKAPSKGPAP